jgi:site-specific DNA recombinase
MTTSPHTVRCAIYTRKSTEEGLDQDFNSLDAQRASGQAYVLSQQQQGWQCLPQAYDDGGYTGANMQRPALGRLLADIAAGQIDCVLVYKVDRLSRSLLDFARMMAIFAKHQVAFVSVTQQFNTATSMGRLVLHVLLSFAQFEREIISERTRDKIAAARRRGKWVGGHPLLGYDIDPQGFKLLVNEEEAAQVRQIFGLYLGHQSVRKVVEELDRRGWLSKCWQTRKGQRRGGRPFSRSALYHLLHNVAYLGKIRYKKEVHVGEHQALVDQATWDQVHALLQAEHSLRGIAGTSGALLKGLLFCGHCGSAMTPAHCQARHKKYRYYICCRKQKRGAASCPCQSLPAQVMDQFVVKQLGAAGAPFATATASLPAGVQQALGWLAQRWQDLALDQQAGLLHRLLERIDYDGHQVHFTFAAAGLAAILSEIPQQANQPTMEMSCSMTL